MHMPTSICMFYCFLLVGCVTSPPSTSLDASAISYNGQNVAIALSDLEAKLLIQDHNSNTDSGSDALEELKQLRKDLTIVQEELTHIRTLLETVQEGGIAHAKLIPFDPRVTTLKAQTLQEAIDEMMARVSILERNVLDNLGQPGPGLFEIPKDKDPSPQGPNQGPGGPNQGPGGPNQGPGGPNQGPGGPPPGGQGGPAPK